jgi:hypothetical protein
MTRMAVTAASALLAALFACTQDELPTAETASYLLVPTTAQIRAGYQERSLAYTPRLRAKLDHIASMAPAACVTEQANLVQESASAGMDGLETVWLAYQDCASQSRSRVVRRGVQANAVALKATLHYAGSIAYQLPQWSMTYHGMLAREIRGEALRAIMYTLVKAEPHYWGLASSARILRLPEVETALCNVPARRNGHGDKAYSEILRQGHCAIPVVADMCEAARNGEAIAFPELASHEVDKLAVLCDSSATGSGLGSSGIDTFSGFVEGGCLGSAEDGIAEASAGIDVIGLAEAMQDCYGSAAGGDPIASGGTFHGSDLIGTKGPGLYIWRGSDGSVHQMYLTENGQYIPLPILPVGESTYDRGDGTTTATTVAAGGTVFSDTTGTVENSDGSTTTVDETVITDSNGTHTWSEQTTTYPDGRHRDTVSESYHDSNGNGTYTSVTNVYDANGNLVGTIETTSTTSTDEDDDQTTTTTTTVTDEEGNKGTITGTEDSGVEPGLDLDNPACQELIELGYVGPDGHSRPDLVALLERGVKDPRVVYPGPDDIDPQTGEDPCDSSYLQSGIACNLPVLCVDGMSNGCTCDSPGAGFDRLRASGCDSANCPPGSYAVPTSGFACTCMTEEQQSGEDDPRGPPGPGCEWCM